MVTTNKSNNNKHGNVYTIKNLFTPYQFLLGIFWRHLLCTNRRLCGSEGGSQMTNRFVISKDLATSHVVSCKLFCKVICNSHHQTFKQNLVSFASTRQPQLHIKIQICRWRSKMEISSIVNKSCRNLFSHPVELSCVVFFVLYVVLYIAIKQPESIWLHKSC